MFQKRKFARMYEKYADDIFRYLLVHVQDTELAEDLTADTFMRAWRNIDSFDFSQPRPWLYKIARNLMTDHWRRKKPEPLSEPEKIESGIDVPAEVEARLTQERLHNTIRRLPEPMRSVITLRFILGYSAKQTADSLDLKENNVRIIQYRALKKMKGLLS